MMKAPWGRASGRWRSGSWREALRASALRPWRWVPRPPKGEPLTASLRALQATRRAHQQLPLRLDGALLPFGRARSFLGLLRGERKLLFVTACREMRLSEQAKR